MVKYLEWCLAHKPSLNVDFWWPRCPCPQASPLRVPPLPDSPSIHHHHGYRQVFTKPKLQTYQWEAKTRMGRKQLTTQNSLTKGYVSGHRGIVAVWAAWDVGSLGQV